MPALRNIWLDGMPKATSSACTSSRISVRGMRPKASRLTSTTVAAKTKAIGHKGRRWAGAERFISSRRVPRRSSCSACSRDRHPSESTASTLKDCTLRWIGSCSELRRSFFKVVFPCCGQHHGKTTSRLSPAPSLSRAPNSR